MPLRRASQAMQQAWGDARGMAAAPPLVEGRWLQVLVCSGVQQGGSAMSRLVCACPGFDRSSSGGSSLCAEHLQSGCVVGRLHASTTPPVCLWLLQAGKLWVAARPGAQASMCSVCRSLSVRMCTMSDSGGRAAAGSAGTAGRRVGAQASSQALQEPCTVQHYTSKTQSSSCARHDACIMAGAGTAPSLGQLAGVEPAAGLRCAFSMNWASVGLPPANPPSAPIGVLLDRCKGRWSP